MRVTLRKASILSKELISAGRRVNVSRSIHLSAFSPKSVSDTVRTAGDQLVKDTKKSLRLIDAGYVIRGLIGLANAEKISTILTERKSHDERISILSSMIADLVVVSDDDIVAIQTELSIARESVDRYRSTSSDIGYPKAAVDEIRSLIAELRARKRLLDDDLAALNSDGHIEIPARIVAILAEEKLV